MGSAFNPSGAWTSGQSTLVAQQTVAGSAVSTISFNGLSGLADGGYVLELDTVSCGVQASINLNINGDTTASNYVSEITGIWNTTTENFNTNAQLISMVGNVVPSVSSAYMNINITSNGSVVVLGQTRFIWQAGNEYLKTIGYRYTPSISDINSLSITASTGVPFGVGTTARLYRKIVNGSAHTIQSAGINMPAEGKMNFANSFTLKDDPTNGATKVDLSSNINLLSNAVSSLVAQQSVTGSAASTITFPNLSGLADGGYTIDLLVVGAAASAAIGLQINGDTTPTNYIHQDIVGTGSTTSATNTTPTNRILFVDTTAPSGIARIDIQIANGMVLFTSIVRTKFANSEYTAIEGVRYIGSLTDITSLVIQGYTQGSNTTLAGCFGVGTTAKLYRKITTPTTVQPVQINPSYLSNLAQEIIIGTTAGYTNASAQITLPNLDGLNDGGYVLEVMLNNATAANIVQLAVNGDNTQANYYNSLTFQSNAASPSGAAAGNSNSLAQADAGTWATIRVDISYSSGSKPFIIGTAKVTNSSGINQSWYPSIQYNGSMTNISSLVLNSSAGSGFGVGTVVRLYKKKLNPALVLTNRYLTNLVEQKNITTDTASITFSGLDSTQDGDYILEMDVTGTNVATSSVNIFINDDETLTNYSRISTTQQTSDGGAISGYVTDNDAAISAVRQQGFSFTRISLACANPQIMISSHECGYDSALSSTSSVTRVVRRKVATASINKIKLSVAGGSTAIKAGSVFRLYKSNSAQQLVPYAVTDISSRTSDYPLKAGETVSVSYSNATSVPLHVTTVEGGEYEITVNGDTSTAIGTQGSVTLSPNNTSYTAGSIKLLESEVSMLITDAGGSTATTGYKDGTGLTKMKVSFSLPIKAIVRISTTMTSKSCTAKSSELRSGSALWNCVIDNYWTDTTTPWTSLGTLGFPFAQSGKVIVRRIT